MMEWLVILNPTARDIRSVEARTRQSLQALRIAAVVEAPRGEQAVRDLIRNRAESGSKRFVAVGGDGTVNLILNALFDGIQWDSPPTLGVLPAGTGCDFIRTFGLPQRIEDAAPHLLGEEIYRTDVGVVEGSWGKRYFLNVAQAGIGAASARRAAALPSRLGPARYTLSVALTLPGFRPAEIDLTVGDRRWQGQAMAVIAANGQFFGGGMNIAPRATVVDGLLDLQVIQGRKRQAAGILARVMRGTHLTHKAVRRQTAVQFGLETDSPWPIEVDGEYLGNTPVRGYVLPGRVDIKI